MSGDKDYQYRYWREMDQLKIHELYIGEYLHSTVTTDRNINIFIAVTSNSSICGWVVWQQFSYIWGGIIALSQLINAITPFLPYKKRLKALYGMSNDINALFLTVESRWFDVSEGKLEIEEIHNLQMGLKKQIRQIEEKHFGQNVLPHNEKFIKKAKLLAESYFKNFYPKEND